MSRPSRLALLALLIAWPAAARAEVIHLKSGKQVEAKVVERTDKYVKVDWHGVAVTYWMDEVERIDTTITDVLQPRLTGPGVTTAGAMPADTVALASHALQLAGVRPFLEQLEADSRKESANPKRQGRLAEADPATRARFHQIVSDAFTADLLEPLVIDAFARQVDQPQRLQSAAAWLGLPLAQRMVALESRAVDDAQYERFVQGMQQQSPDPARLALVERLDTALHASEMTLDAIHAMLTGLSQPLAAAGKISPQEVSEMMDKTRATFRQQYGELFRAAIQVKMLFTYHDASLEDLAQYVAWWESEDGRWFGDRLYRAITQALSQGSARAGEQMVKLMQEMQPVQPAAAP